MARITINTLVNQVKKVIANKAGNPFIEKAYVNGNGDIIAANYGGNEAITAFIAGVFQDAASDDLNKLYNKDALSIYAKTGVLAGGVELPEAYDRYFTIPEDDYTTLCTVTPETLKNINTAVSRDNTRPFITGFNINMDAGYIEGVDGFRAYREAIEICGKVDNAVIIPGIVANYAYKGNVEIAAGKKYARLIDSITGFTVYAELVKATCFVNLAAIYEKNARFNTVRVNDLDSIIPFLKAACKCKKDGRNAGITFIRFKDNKLDYAIPDFDIYGSLATDCKDMPEAAAAYNPHYLLDAITAAGNTISFDTKSIYHAPLMVGNPETREALLLPIREDVYTISDAFKPLDIKKDNTAPENKPETAPDNSEVNHVTDNSPETIQEAPAPAAPDLEPVTPAQDATRALNEKQHQENKFTNITPEDVEKQAAAIKAAQGYYKALQGYKLTGLQAITAEAIYKANKPILQPIARRAGGLYIDNIAIIAAITAANDLYQLTEV